MCWRNRRVWWTISFANPRAGFWALCFEGGLKGHAIAWLVSVPLCSMLLVGASRRTLGRCRLYLRRGRCCFRSRRYFVARNLRSQMGFYHLLVISASSCSCSSSASSLNPAAPAPSPRCKTLSPNSPPATSACVPLTTRRTNSRHRRPRSKKSSHHHPRRQHRTRWHGQRPQPVQTVEQHHRRRHPHARPHHQSPRCQRHRTGQV